MVELIITFILAISIASIHATPFVETKPALFPDVGARIIDGQEAYLGEFPHMVSVRWDRNTGEASFHRCGGSLIDDIHILTAAHCQLEEPGIGFFVIWAGRLNLDEEEVWGQERRVVQEFHHPKFISGLDPHDIAVVSDYLAQILYVYFKILKLK